MQGRLLLGLKTKEARLTKVERAGVRGCTRVSSTEHFWSCNSKAECLLYTQGVGISKFSMTTQAILSHVFEMGKSF